MTWFCVQTHARAEEKARFNLERQGFEVYFPRYLKRRSHARRIEEVRAPVFPRYLFVRFDAATAPWRKILSTFGVSTLVCFGERPAPVPTWIIDELKAQERETGLIPLAQRTVFEKGQRVSIAYGAMAGQIAAFDHVSDNERVCVLLDLMGRQVKIHLPGDAVASA